jgi:hypothetical protein
MKFWGRLQAVSIGSTSSEAITALHYLLTLIILL